MINERKLCELITDEDIRYLSEQAGYRVDTIFEEYHYGCDAALKIAMGVNPKLFKQDHCQYGFYTCPCFSQFIEDKEHYLRPAIYVNKSVALKCPVMCNLLKAKELRKKRERWIRKFNKKRA
jgi:hypothetical protein